MQKFGRFTARTTGLDVWLGLVERVGLETVGGNVTGTRQRFIETVDTILGEFDGAGIAQAQAQPDEAVSLLSRRLDTRFTPEAAAALIQVIRIIRPVSEAVDLRLFFPNATDSWLESRGETWDLIQVWADHTGGVPEDVANASQPVDRARAWLTGEWPSEEAHEIVNNKQVASWVACQRVAMIPTGEDVPTVVDSFISMSRVTELEAALEVANAAVAEREGIIESLNAQNNTLRATNIQQRQEHLDDIGTVQRVFWKEAWERSWCGEAETVIREMNETLHVAISTDRHANRPESDWDVEGYVNVTFRDSNGEEWECSNHDFSLTEITAVDSDTVSDEVRDGEHNDDIETYVLSRMRNGGLSGWTIVLGDIEVNSVSQS